MLALLIACTSDEPPDDTAADAVDMRLTDAPAPPDGGLQLIGPDVVVEPYSDQMFCLVGTYEGDDVGITSYDVYQGEYGHHMVLFGTTASELDYPDGYTYECTELQGDVMAMAEPLVFAPTFGPGENLMSLPSGMAAPLDNRQRYVIQAHYVNPTADALRVQDVINLGLVSEDSVTTWTAPFAFNTLEHSLPPGEESSYVFEATIAGTFEVLFLFGHMHEWGTSITFERIPASGEAELLYEVNPWATEYRDAPPVNDYREETLSFNDGDTVRLTCNWFNDTDAPLEFPHEMCDASGMLFPANTAQIYTDEGEGWVVTAAA